MQSSEHLPRTIWEKLTKQEGKPALTGSQTLATAQDQNRQQQSHKFLSGLPFQSSVDGFESKLRTALLQVNLKKSALMIFWVCVFVSLSPGEGGGVMGGVSGWSEEGLISPVLRTHSVRLLPKVSVTRAESHRNLW